jgi:mannosyltransferase
MATVAPPPAATHPPASPVGELQIPRRLKRISPRVAIPVSLVLLTALSLFLRTRYLSGQFWEDEGLSVGISSHSLAAIPGILRHDGSPPLYYVLLHVWMSVFGSSESATHSFSLLCSMLTIPIGTWTAWSLWGRRAGLSAAVLFAFNAFLTNYGQESRMYALMALLGLLATTGFLYGFVYRRRRYLVLFAVALSLMLYTHAWGLFFGAGAALALIPVWYVSEDRRPLVRDAVLSFVGAGVLFLPWLPNFLYQMSHTGAPWDSAPRFGAPVQLSRDLLGGDRVTAVLVLAAGIGLAALFTKRWRRTREATAMWALIAIPAATLILAWIASHVTPAWVSRYFAPILASILLLGALGVARAGVAGPIALALSVIFLINPASYVAKYKSDMRAVGGEVAQYLHPGDVVLSGQPDQIALAWYYMPSGLRWADLTGPVKDPRYFNWVDALSRLRRANPQATLARLVASLGVGQQLLYVRPLTEGAKNWEAPWTQLVRRRAAQWGALLAADHSLQPVAVAPHNYRGSSTVGDSAVLYRKIA